MLQMATITMSRLVTLLVLSLTITWPSNSEAQTLEERFKALLVEINSFAPKALPLPSPQKFRYHPVSGATDEMSFLARMGDLHGRVSPVFVYSRAFKAYDRTVTSSGDLKTVSEYKVDQTKLEGGGKVTPKDDLPEGTKIISIMDNVGNLKGVQFVPPRGVDPSILPQPGTQKFQEAIKRVIGTTKIPDRALSAGDKYSEPVLYPIGAPAKNMSLGGHAPVLVGRVACEVGYCLYVKIDETMEHVPDENQTEGNATLKGSAKGYLLFSEKTFRGVKSLIWIHSEVRSKNKNQETDLIIQTTAIDGEHYKLR